MRHNFFITNIMEGRINGPKGRGRLKKTFIEEMFGIAGCNVYSYKKPLALKKEEEIFFC